MRSLSALRPHLLHRFEPAPLHLFGCHIFFARGNRPTIAPFADENTISIARPAPVKVEISGRLGFGMPS
jgi:hypothetical protein